MDPVQRWLILPRSSWWVSAVIVMLLFGLYYFQLIMPGPDFDWIQFNSARCFCYTLFPPLICMYLFIYAFRHRWYGEHDFVSESHI